MNTTFDDLKKKNHQKVTKYSATSKKVLYFENNDLTELTVGNVQCGDF